MRMLLAVIVVSFLSFSSMGYGEEERYKILRNSDFGSLERNVNLWLKQGWKCHNGLTIDKFKTGSGFARLERKYYVQVIIKDDRQQQISELRAEVKELNKDKGGR